ncbi:MAG: V-type ATP synthase subunit I [Bacteroidales bacterium]
MKKITFLIYHQEYAQVLEDIRTLGILHVIEKGSGELEDESLRELIDKEKRTKNAIRLLTSALGDERKPSNEPFNIDDHLKNLDELIARRDKINLSKQSIQKEIEHTAPWGNFKRDSIELLEQAGYKVEFFTCNLRSFSDEWVERYNAQIINNIGSVVYFITICKEGVDIDAERIKISSKSLESLKASLGKCNSDLKEIHDRMERLASEELDSFENASENLLREIEFSKVILNTEKHVDDKLMMLEGWIPSQRESEVTNYFNDHALYFEYSEPLSDEQPPVLMNNNAFARLFEPITRVFSLPNYHELDLTPYLAPFFMLFFGFCTGDAGYGLLIFLIGTIGKIKKKEFKDYFSLAQFLGMGAILFGVLSGTFFGIEVAKLEALKSVRDYFLTMDNLMALSITLGAIQVLFGMGINAANTTRKKGFKYALSKIAWIVILLSLIPLAGAPQFGIQLPEVVNYIAMVTLVLGAIVALFYNSPDKNILMNFGGGLWETYGMATGIMGDLLSYIRLFALGLTGGILGNVFNQLAFAMSPDVPVVGIIVTIFILLLGHTIAFALTILGAMIHPIRLTFVEFYKNAGFEGGGKEYQPLK